MKQIKLTQGRIALVDDEQFDELSKFKWHAHKSTNKYYAARFTKENKIIYMHHQVIGKPNTGMETDHINGNSLDNRKINLRHCSTSQNQMNIERQTRSKSAFKCVSIRHNKNGNTYYSAYIAINGKSKYLGSFPCEASAALAYNEAAKINFGEFARLNAVPERKGGINMRPR